MLIVAAGTSLLNPKGLPSSLVKLRTARTHRSSRVTQPNPRINPRRSVDPEVYSSQKCEMLVDMPQQPQRQRAW
jgi:hypothetical protein